MSFDDPEYDPEIKKLNAKIQSLEKTHKDALEKYQATEKNTSQRLQLALQELTHATNENQRVHKDLEERDKELEELRSRDSRYRQDIHQLESTISTLEQRLKDSLSNDEPHGDDKLQKEIDSINQEKHEILEKLEESYQDAGKAQLELGKTKKEAAELRKTVDNLTSENHNFSREVEELVNTNMSLEDHISKLQNEMDENINELVMTQTSMNVNEFQVTAGLRKDEGGSLAAQFQQVSNTNTDSFNTTDSDKATFHIGGRGKDDSSKSTPTNREEKKPSPKPKEVEVEEEKEKEKEKSKSPKKDAEKDKNLAMKEFRHLTAMSVKLKYPELELSTRELIKHVANHPFHEIYDLMTLYCKNMTDGKKPKSVSRSKAYSRSKGKSSKVKKTHGPQLLLFVKWGEKAYQTKLREGDKFERLYNHFENRISKTKDQVLSYRSDILPPHLTVKEAKLQDGAKLVMHERSRAVEYFEDLKRRDHITLGRLNRIKSDIENLYDEKKSGAAKSGTTYMKSQMDSMVEKMQNYAKTCEALAKKSSAPTKRGGRRRASVSVGMHLHSLPQLPKTWRGDKDQKKDAEPSPQRRPRSFARRASISALQSVKEC